MKTLDELMLLADEYADASHGTTHGAAYEHQSRAALAAALKDALNTTPTVPLGNPGGGHTVGEVITMADKYAFYFSKGSPACERDRADLLAAIERMVSDREVLLSALKDLLSPYAMFPSCQSGLVTKCVCIKCADERAREAIQKVTK